MAAEVNSVLVEHSQVTKVLDGHRITLTYVLHRKMDTSSNPTADQLLLRASKLHEALCAALASKTFMPEGGNLGFFCRHLYEETQLAQVWHGAPQIEKFFRPLYH